MRWAGKVVSMGKNQKAIKILDGKPEQMRPLTRSMYTQIKA
jgi:hypothetical protein